VAEALAALAVGVGAALQSAVGFGFALLAAPVLFAVVGPRPAVGALLVLAVEINLLALLGERRRREVLRSTTARILGWSVPGALAGALALRSLPAAALQVAVAVVVFAALAQRAWPGAAARRAGALAGPRGAALAGLASGALTTSTGASGPPIVLHLLARRATPDETRDTLMACFTGLCGVGAVALAALGALSLDVAPALLAALLACALAGQLAGRRGFRALREGRHERAVELLLAVSALAALVAGLT
jgi:uncharacterized membrane protein YfcA